MTDSAAPDLEPIFYTSEETARVLRTTIATLRNWRYKGRGPRYTRISDNRVLYRVEDVKAYIESRRHPE